jgi:lysozyme family protein
MAKFEDAINVVLLNEGERFTDNPHDPGGATKWGITFNSAQAHGFCQTIDQLKSISRKQASDFYRQYYWSSIYNKIKDQSIATKIFDAGVNVGPVVSVQFLQRALNNMNVGTLTSQLNIDGHIGPQTLTAVNAADPIKLLEEYRKLQADHYTSWVAADPTDRTEFLKGLLNRVQSC